MDWKEIVKSVAPVVGTALGGPMAGGALKFLATSLLGDENATEQDIETYVTEASPDQLLEIKKLDNDFKYKMEKLGVDLYKIETEGRGNARSAHKHSSMPTIICILLTIMVTGGAATLMLTSIPHENTEILHMLFGQVMTAWTASIAYWVGTTRSSGDKSRMLGIAK